MKKIAIIGASYLQIPIVRKAKEMGIETHCFAWEDGAVCKTIADYFYPISILDKEKIFEICKTIEIDGITTIATDMAVPTICYIAEKLNLVSNSYYSSLISTNKGLMRKAFEEKKINCPKFLVADLPIEQIEGFRYPVIIKPVDRSGSRGVKKVETPFQIKDAVKYAISESFIGNAIIEEFIEGKEFSVETISWEGVHYILAITEKVTTGAPHFVELSHHQPSSLPKFVQEQIKIETQKVLDSLNIKFGAGHTEFKITDKNEIFVIEVGARMGGDFIGSHMVQLSTGYDFVKGVIDVALNQFTEPIVNIQKHSGVYFLCEETKSLMPFFEKNNDFDVEKNIQNNVLVNVTNSNDRSGYLIYQSSKKIELS